MAVLPTLPELTDDNLTVITVRQTEGDKTVRLSKTDSGWVNGGKALPDGIADIEAALADFTFDKCFNYDPSPDAAPLCGLDVPTATITLSYVNTVGTESSVVLTLGKMCIRDRGLAVFKGGVFLLVPVAHVVVKGGGHELGHVFI